MGIYLWYANYFYVVIMMIPRFPRFPKAPWYSKIKQYTQMKGSGMKAVSVIGIDDPKKGRSQYCSGKYV